MDKDKRAQFPAYPRRGVLKAGVLIGAFTGLAVKMGAADPLNALDERQIGHQVTDTSGATSKSGATSQLESGSIRSQAN
jgi:hypothetical protein